MLWCGWALCRGIDCLEYSSNRTKHSDCRRNPTEGRWTYSSHMIAKEISPQNSRTVFWSFIWPQSNRMGYRNAPSYLWDDDGSRTFTTLIVIRMLLSSKYFIFVVKMSYRSVYLLFFTWIVFRHGPYEILREEVGGGALGSWSGLIFLSLIPQPDFCFQVLWQLNTPPRLVRKLNTQSEFSWWFHTPTVTTRQLQTWTTAAGFKPYMCSHIRCMSRFFSQPHKQIGP